MAVRGLGCPVRFALTAGHRGDAPQAETLIEGLSADFVMADTAYDSDRLRDAIERFDITEIERITQILDVDSERLTFARAEIGTRGQSLEALTRRNKDEQVELKSALSVEIDMDIAQAATDYVMRQAAYEAALNSIANLHSLSLLNYM